MSVEDDLFGVRLGLPPAFLFRFPPDSRPSSLPPPPPPAESSWLQPFTIPPRLFNSLLGVHVPLTVAFVYATTVVLLNRLNRKRGHRPWPVSQTRLFRFLVILHNVFLAVYSTWTFVGMTSAFHASMPKPHDQHERPHRLVAAVDAMCKVNGPRGLGNAAIYDRNAGRWSMPNPAFHLTEAGTPDPTDVGRLWNSGLAFFGWLFYLSKFYEVLDTVIILAKGKRSSTLQTYHHAGAMMCMWAGIRYMAAPIWIFTIFNSLIHAAMYFYYTLTALSVRVPVRVKRSLTTLQIVQFIIGCSLAALHMCVYYSMPVTEPWSVSLRPLAGAAPAPSASVVAAAASSATAEGGFVPWLKKLVLRAAGAEGVAENVANANGTLFGIDGRHALQAARDHHQEVRHSIVPRTFTCLDTSGQGFAVWLNVLYLLPLTFLFARFFVRSYLQRSDGATKHPTHAATPEKAGMDALKGVTRELRNAVSEMHGEGEDGESSEGGAAAIESGTATPQHPDAYEANVDTIMSGKQRRAERRASSTTTRPEAPKLAATGTSTPPADPSAYEASVEDVMTRKQQGVEERTHRPARRPSHVEPLPSSKAGIGTPRDEKGYEANVEDVMSPSQKHVEEKPADSSAPKVREASSSTPTPSPATKDGSGKRKVKK